MGIMDEIGFGPVCLDTCVFIYFMEESKKYLNLVVKIFKAIDQRRLMAVTSGITLLETLVMPLRSKDIKLANKYEQILLKGDGLRMFTIDTILLRQAAILRANYSIKTPDALQIAAAKLGQCNTFVTNDRRLPIIPNLKILQLDDYL